MVVTICTSWVILLRFRKVLFRGLKQIVGILDEAQVLEMLTRVKMQLKVSVAKALLVLGMKTWLVGVQARCRKSAVLQVVLTADEL